MIFATRSAPAHRSSRKEPRVSHAGSREGIDSPFAHYLSRRPDLLSSRGGDSSSAERIRLHHLASSVGNEKKDRMPPRRSRLQQTEEISRTENLSHDPENPNLTAAQIAQLLVATRRRRRPPCAAAARRRSSPEICSDQFDVENPIVLISSGLLVQSDEGVSDLVVDRIGVSTAIYREEPGS
ncbi:TMV resistance protein N-like [Dorcoceras hygrometricum]|uniref:TMV resistance protein N-like n=1 Tax=Dorcoceras hygrometricum TaxID=472368 RepID=A0A2Z7D004_9LAMI|nr:TMV resistance protein N-like [Dorcoceras hygrometricum]